ncbi:ThiF family adenylyltransferase [Muricauda sp. NFXS6]|uniref:ThiF family adenylyltransferase n=1 Tax=Allomuricauda sp. NFXS6 TaxID=2819094 RepID=UPI0032DE464C
MELEDLFEHLCKTEKCRIVDAGEYEGLKYPFTKGGQVWEITSEITFEGGYIELVFYLDFPPDFPYKLPKLYIKEDIYDPIKYIPHVNKDCSICIFDDGLNTVIPKDDLLDFVEFILYRGKKIIKDGEDNSYKEAEFKKEFKAYWDLEYSNKDEIFLIGLHSVSDPTKEIKGVAFQGKSLARYHYFLYTEEEDLMKIKAYAKSKGCDIKKVAVIEIDFTKTIPPFQMTYEDSLDHIKKVQEKYQLFKQLCKTKSLNEILVVFRNREVDSIEYYGWNYEELQIPPRKQGGPRRRPTNLEILSASGWGKSKHVRRLTFDNLSVERLSKRASGVIEEESCILCTGLGSVGSNLIYFLKNLPVNRFGLIDPEKLGAENIKRNLMGFSGVGDYKVDVLGDYLLDCNPMIEIQRLKVRVATVIQKKPDFINSYDIHIVAVGKTMVEEYILNAMESGVLTKPTIMLWVEPYLASGQVLFVNPADAKAAQNLIRNFKYAVLTNEDINMDVVYLVEGSCQSGYFPYSSTYLTQFLAAVFPSLKEAVLIGFNKSEVYTWVGDKDFVASKGLKFSDFGEAQSSFTLIKNEIV